MPHKTIRVVYRKIIDRSSISPWDRLVFDDTYAEFLMQAQFYNRDKKFSSFCDIPAATKLQFLVSAAVTGYLQQLGGIIPDTYNTIGKLFLPFSNYHFEIIDSDIKDERRHRIAISFFSEPLTWCDTIGDLLLVAVAGASKAVANQEEVLTDMFWLQPPLGIYSLSIDQTPQNKQHDTTCKSENVPGR